MDRSPSTSALCLALLLAAVQALLLASLALSTPRIVLQDSSGRSLDRILAEPRSAQTPPVSEGVAAPASLSAGCGVPEIRLVAVAEERWCEYCYFIPGPYGCHDSLCYDSLCQYVGVCAGCNERYLSGCSGCAQDEDCICCL